MLKTLKMKKCRWITKKLKSRIKELYQDWKILNHEIDQYSHDPENQMRLASHLVKFKTIPEYAHILAGWHDCPAMMKAQVLTTIFR